MHFYFVFMKFCSGLVVLKFWLAPKPPLDVTDRLGNGYVAEPSVVETALRKDPGKIFVSKEGFSLLRIIY